MKRTVLLAAFLIGFSAAAFAQSRRTDIKLSETPPEVIKVLKQYVSILRSSKSLDECAERFVAVAGGSLVNEDGTLRGTVKPFSLKKDFNDVKHYADPIKITRVNSKNYKGNFGYGATAIRGRKYKIWIDKKDKSLGMPAPISIVVPEGHPTIKTPKVVNIGSL